MESHADGRAPGEAGSGSPSFKIVLSILSMRWSVPALAAIADGHARFNALQRQLAGISHKVLTETLRVLQRDGFVYGPLTSERDNGNDVTLYRLTPVGRELFDRIGDLEHWVRQSEPQLLRARVEFERRAVRRDGLASQPTRAPSPAEAAISRYAAISQLRRLNGLQ
jgi:DNA-binding HxlR family transcriptional regulator